MKLIQLDYLIKLYVLTGIPRMKTCGKYLCLLFVDTFLMYNHYIIISGFRPHCQSVHFIPTYFLFSTIVGFPVHNMEGVPSFCVWYVHLNMLTCFHILYKAYLCIFHEKLTSASLPTLKVGQNLCHSSKQILGSS